MPLLEKVTDLDRQADVLRRRRYGVIEFVDQRFSAVYLRPWPKVISLAEIWWWGNRFHHRTAGDRGLLYYNQPWGHENFLTLKYAVSSRDVTLPTCYGALQLLDEIARLKGTDAIVTEVSNRRISDRVLTRMGWERHLLNSRRRHYIKRFYGTYPAAELSTRLCAGRMAPPAR